MDAQQWEEVRGRLRVMRSQIDALEQLVDRAAGEGRQVNSLPQAPPRPLVAPPPFPGPPRAIPFPPGRPIPTLPSPAPGTAWHERPGATAQVMAMIGAFVLLVGIVLLLVGGHAGVLPPGVAVGLSTLASVVMIALGLSLKPLVAPSRDRARPSVAAAVPPENPGAIALAGVGFSGLLLTVWALTNLFRWCAPGVGAGAAGVLALAGLLLARRRKSQALHVIIVGGTSLMGLNLSSEMAWNAVFCLVIAAAGLAAQDHRLRWPVATVSRSLFVPLAVVAAAHNLVSAFAALGFTVVALVEVVLDSRKHPTSWLSAVPLVMSTLPWLVLDDLSSRIWWVASSCVVVLHVLTALALQRPGRSSRPRSATVLVLVAAGLVLFPMDSRIDTGAAWFLPAAAVLGYALWAKAATQQQPMVASTVLGGVVVLLCGWWVGALLLRTLTEQRLHLWHLGSAVLLTGAVIVQAGWWARSRRVPGTVRLWRALAALVPGSAALVLSGSLAGRALGRAETGFVLGHVMATIAWAAVGVWLMMWLRPRSTSPREIGRLGVVLVLLAVGKLFLFDLQALDGVFRVAAFFVVGLLLVGVGVRQGNQVHRNDAPAQPPGAPVTPTRPHRGGDE